MMAVGTARDEPLQSFFESFQLAEQVQRLRFAEVSDFGPDEAAKRYFTGRDDGFQPSVLNHHMRARVGPRSN
jgi:hypothetical protein